MLFTYVFALTSFASYAYTPPPSQPGVEDPSIWYPDPSNMPMDEEEDEEPDPVLTITSGMVRFNVGERFRIQYKMEDFPPGTLLEWQTSNTAVAVISSDGVLLAVSPGNVEVIAIAGDKRASVLATVNEIVADHIVILISGDIVQTGTKKYEIELGDVIRLSTRILPEGAKVNRISWKLGNEKVAKISPNFQTCEVVAIEAGETTVSVTADNISDTITFTVIASGLLVGRLQELIGFAVIIVVAIVAVLVFFSWRSNKRKKEIARQKAAAARRKKEEAEQRAHEEAERAEMQRELRSAQTENRETLKINGAAVGAGLPAPPSEGGTKQERPVTLDDLD